MACSQRPKRELRALLLRWPYHDACPPPDALEQAQQVWACRRDAALCWRVGGRCHVHEDGAAPTAHARPGIAGEDDDHIVEAVLAPQLLGACRVGVAHRPIIVAVPDRIAPA